MEIAYLFGLMPRATTEFLTKTLMALAVFVSLAACFSRPPGHLAQKNPNFRTLITATHIKRFELVVLPKTQDPFNGPARRSERNGEDNNEGALQRRTDAYLKYQLEAIMAATTYCRDGYFLLGRFAGESQYRLRGECKDAASEEDRKKFPNTIAQW